MCWHHSLPFEGFHYDESPNFLWAQDEEDAQEFNDEFYEILYSMGSTTCEKAKLDTYQLKDVAQAWYVQWRDNMTLRGGTVTWEVFKKAFIDRFFPGEK